MRGISVLLSRITIRFSAVLSAAPIRQPWIDNPPYTWCYEAIQEATNSHDYTKTDKQSPEHDFNYEAWLRINPVPNWAGLEREWSTANSK